MKKLLESLVWVKRIEADNGRFIVILEEGKTAADLNQRAFQEGLMLNHLVSKKRSLETEFLEITKNQ